MPAAPRSIVVVVIVNVVVAIIVVVVGSRLAPEVVVASVFGAGGFASDFVRGFGVSSLGCRVVDLRRVVE